MRGMPLGSQTSHRLAGNMNETQLGILLWNQGTDWPTFERAARRVDELGYEHLWAWDHLYAIFGDPYQPIYEAYTTLAARAMVTSRVRLGLMVGAVTSATPGAGGQDDHQSRPDEPGRDARHRRGPFELEHTAYGLDFGRSGVSGSTGWTRPSPRSGAAESRLAHLPSPGGTTSSTTCACSPARCSPGWRS